MAAEGEFLRSERENFRSCCYKLGRFVYRDDDSSRTNLNVLLDELNATEVSQRNMSEHEGNDLLIKLARLVPFHQERLIAKICQSITNFKLKHQYPINDPCLECLLDFCITAIQRCPSWTHPDLLLALSAVLHENSNRVSRYHEVFLGKQGILVQLAEDGSTDEDILTGVVQCLENLTAKVPAQNILSDEHLRVIFSIFLRLLHSVPSQKIDPIVQCKILICSLRGTQNLLLTTKLMPTDDLGPLLAAVRAYMFHGMTSSQSLEIPASLYPSPIVQLEGQSKTPPKNKAAEKSTESEESSAKSGKKSRRKKAAKKDKQKDPQKEEDEGEKVVVKEKEDVKQETYSGSENSGIGAALFQPSWMKISSSDSDYSDTEGGQAARLRSLHAKVRQSAFTCFHSLAKNLDKKIMFGYWSSFIPDSAGAGNSPQMQTLFTSILKDPSPMCRMGALSALSALVDGTKTFLAQAEENYQVRTAFVPFSAILGSMIKELHRCLLLALVAENFSLALTQLIKCLATVVSNTPYHRLHPGLLTRIVKQIRHFLANRDPNVRVACLTCLGAIVSIQPPIMEVCHLIQPSAPPVSTKIYPTEPAQNPTEDQQGSDSGYHSNMSCDLSTLTSGSGQSSGLGTPALAGTPGSQTPVFTDQVLQAHAKETSWIIKLCIRSVIPQPQADSSNNWRDTSQMGYEPLPVRLESLQVLANLTKAYFPIIRKSVALLQDLIQACFEDKDPVVKLHGTKLLDEMTQAMLQDIQNTESVETNKITITQVQEFWQYLLSGPLPTLLQMERNNQVRSNACDCISNIGPEVFALLPMNRRILCITLVLGLTCEDDKLVKSSAVRALGVYVLFPSLREDVSFMADAANAILTAMEDSSVNVRMKAAWSMANMCDALALNREGGDLEFVDEFSDMLLLKLLTVATKSSQDNDKVKSNAVRAVGNLLRYLTERSLGKSNFVVAVEDSIKALVKNILSGTMKVRWNACYAVSNMFKNNLLPHGKAEWTIDVMTALSNVVKDCKNFKVRINAALALTVPKERSAYGSPELYASVWGSLVVALKLSDEISDFAEFKYQDNLSVQILEAIFHMLVLLTPEDLVALLKCLQNQGYVIQEYMDKLHTSQAKFLKGPTLERARSHLQNMASTVTTADDLVAMQLLTEICLLPQDVKDEEMLKPVEKTAFKQIYD